MATTLKNVLQFTGLVVGVPTPIPHRINLDGRALVPQLIVPDRGPYTIAFDSINVTVTRTASSPSGTVNVYVEYFYSPESVFPPPQGSVPAGVPFVVGTGAGAVAATTPVASFVYRPGDPGPTAPNVYTDWNTLVTALATVQGRKWLIFDATYQDPIVIPAGGPYDMTSVEWRGLIGPLIVNLTIPEGASFTNLRLLDGYLRINWTGTTPAITDIGNGEVLLLARGVVIQNNGAGPFISFASLANGELARVVLTQGGQLAVGNGPILHIPNAGSTVQTYNIAFGAIFPDTISGVAGSTWVRILLDPSARIDGPQPSFLGTIFDQSLDVIRWPPDPTVHVAPIPLQIGQVHKFDTSGGLIGVTLPQASDVPSGSSIWIKKVAGAAGLFVGPAGTDTIDGIPAGVGIAAVNGSLMFLRDDVSLNNWLVLGNGP